MWLDLSQSANISYVDAGSAYEGWQYATYKDVSQLVNSYFPAIRFTAGLGERFGFEQACANTSECFDWALIWQELFGFVVGNLSYQTHSWGFYLDSYQQVRMAGAYKNGTGSANIYGIEYSLTHDETQANPLYGTFLIQTVPAIDEGELGQRHAPAKANAVNTPTTLFLLFLSLLIVGVHRRLTRR